VRLEVEENQAGRPFRLDDLLLINQLWLERHLAVSEAALVIQKPIAEARSILERLTESGIVDARGESKNRSYQLSAHTCKRLGQEAAYEGQRGLQPVQAEQMALQYVKAYGKITRKQAAELCKIFPMPTGFALRSGSPAH